VLPFFAMGAVGQSRSKPPWEQFTPRGSRAVTLPPRAKGSLRASAPRTGRRYPNLVDRMPPAESPKGRGRRLAVTRGPGRASR
jgi:hypothetical protein